MINVALLFLQVFVLALAVQTMAKQRRECNLTRYPPPGQIQVACEGRHKIILWTEQQG